jgi:hypothetical protein
VDSLIADIASNLLASDGITTLYHLANIPRTFQEFRGALWFEFCGRSRSDTGAVAIDDPTTQVVLACRPRGLPLHEVQFTTDLHFWPLGNNEWTSFKAPLTYDALAERIPLAYEDLKRLYFVVQRAPLEFASDL